jgi:hypothetical protein
MKKPISAVPLCPVPVMLFLEGDFRAVMDGKM